MKPSQPSHTISKILEITDQSNDAWKYLQFFRAQPKEKFALIYPDTESILESWDSLFHDLRVLWQLELYPIVIMNSSIPGYVKRFLRAGFNEPEEYFFPITLLRRPGDKKERVLDSIYNKKRIPILLQNPNNFSMESVSELLEDIGSNKLILLKQKSGIRSVENSRISLINLSREYNNLMSDEKVSEEDKSLLEEIKNLMDHNSNRRLTISMTSASQLLKELFTVSGSGTLFKRGSSIVHSNSLQSVDKDRVIRLVESSFQRKCSSEFISNLYARESDWEIIFESQYKACALFRKTSHGILLSKFAVDEIARGEGVGREIWDRMKDLYPFVFWRARKENPISIWYMKEADGMIKMGKWIYFWMGKMDPVGNTMDIIPYMESLPEDWDK